MKQQPVTVPDLGGAEDVEVIEVSVKEGADVALEQTLVVLESDKASMEVPSPLAGKVASIQVKPGDRVRMGDLILQLQVEGAAEQAPPQAVAAPAVSAPAAIAAEPPRAPTGAATSIALLVPDMGGASGVEVIEIGVRVGDHVNAGDPLLVMESDKASMELPAPQSGTVAAISVRVGSQLQSGQQIGELRIDSAAALPAAAAVVAPASAAATAQETPEQTAPLMSATTQVATAEGDSAAAITRVMEKERRTSAGLPHAREAKDASIVYAGPAARQLARELGVQLEGVQGSGPKGRVLKEDVQAYVKQRLSAPQTTAAALPMIPEVDFAAFGPVETQALNPVQKAIVTNMSRSWLNVPHVTQFDYADVTDLEGFRDSLKAEMAQRDNKLTPLPFLLLACARALREHPRFNASLHGDGKQLVMKQYVHVGIAVDTPMGLMVPVIRDVDRKSMWELAAEARELAQKARNRKLKPGEMQGGCFTISSLGNIGGEGFTPIVNAPEVAILGVSKLAIRPVWNGREFLPRKTLPLSLSYDHRVINGADAGGFLTTLVGLLADIRRLLL